MKLKSLLSLLFIFTLLFSLPLPVAAEEATPEEYTSADGNYRYILENETVTITYIEKSALEKENDGFYSDYLLNIPASIDGYPVKKIGDNVGADNSLFVAPCDFMTLHLSIAEGIEHIGNNAFKNRDIDSLSLPNTLLTIGDYAFYHSYTGEFILPESLVSVGDYAFRGIFDPEVYKPLSLTIPKNLTRIGKAAFTTWCYLITITVDPKNPAYHSDGNCLIETATKTLRVGSRNSIIPNDGSVTTIADYAFTGSHIANITIPRSIIKIGKDNFNEKYISVVCYEGSVTEWKAIEIDEGNEGLTKSTKIQFLGKDTTPPTTTEAPTTTVPTTTTTTTKVPTTTTTSTKAPTTTTTTKAPTTTKSTTSATATTTTTTTTITDVVTTTVDVTTTDVTTVTTTDVAVAATTTADVAAAATTTTVTTTTATPPPAPKGQFPWWVLLIAIPVAAAGVGVTIVVLKKRRSDA